jgi:hypothetical protein
MSPHILALDVAGAPHRSSVDDLKRVNGIPGGLIEDLRPLLLVNGETHERAPR